MESSESQGGAAVGRSRLHGDVILSNTSLHLSLVIALLFITISIAVWALTGSYARTESVVGFVTPDGVVTKVTANRPGVVTRLDVEDGSVVKAGQLVAVILVAQRTADRSDPTGDDLLEIDKQRALGREQISLSKQSMRDETSKLSAAIDQGRAQISMLDLQIANQNRMVQSARDSFEPLTDAANDGYVSKLQFETQRQQYLSAQNQLNQLKSQRAQVASELRQSEIAKVELPKQSATKINDISSNQSNLLQRRIELENTRTYVVTAPMSGKIVGLQIGQGSAVGPTDTLFSIVDNRVALHAELYAPTKAVGFAKTGQEVRLLYDAFPYQRFGSFGGRITNISTAIVPPEEIDPIVRAKLKDPAYKLEVALDQQSVAALGKHFPLQSGMTLTANIILDRRSFIDWLLDPVNSVRNRS